MSATAGVDASGKRFGELPRCHNCRAELNPATAIVVPDGRFYHDPCCEQAALECDRIARKRLGVAQ